MVRIDRDVHIGTNGPTLTNHDHVRVAAMAGTRAYQKSQKHQRLVEGEHCQAFVAA